MSDTHDEAHTGAIKNPKQFLTSTILAFVLPIFIIIGLVVFVTSGSKPNAGVGNLEMAIAQRIQKVGNVEVRDANRPLRAGEAVYNGQCAACHATGAAGAPKLGDAAAWPVSAAIRHFREEFEWHVNEPRLCMDRNYGLVGRGTEVVI